MMNTEDVKRCIHEWFLEAKSIKEARELHTIITQESEEQYEVTVEGILEMQSREH